MRSKLELRFRPDDEWCGELTATVSHGAFAGASSAWFDNGTLRSFGTSLRDTFPIPRGELLEIRGGAGEVPLVVLRVTPTDVRGTIVMRVDLGTLNDTYPIFDERSMLSVPMSVQYQALSDFGAELVELIDGKRASAELLGDAN